MAKRSDGHGPDANTDEEFRDIELLLESKIIPQTGRVSTDAEVNRIYGTKNGVRELYERDD